MSEQAPPYTTKRRRIPISISIDRYAERVKLRNQARDILNKIPLDDATQELILTTVRNILEFASKNRKLK